jgi:hypothetical protein
MLQLFKNSISGLQFASGATVSLSLPFSFLFSFFMPSEVWQIDWPWLPTSQPAVYHGTVEALQVGYVLFLTGLL